MKVISANVPTLRFPGYSSQAKTQELGKITKVIDCKHRTPKYVVEGIPIVSPGSIRWGEIDLVSPTKRVTDQDYESLMDHCKPGVGDLVLSRNQSLGIASHITSDEKFVLGQDTVLIQQKNSNGKLIFYRLQTSQTQNLISRLSGGSTFSRINLKDIRLLPMVLPTEESEQRKIAGFLTAVDGRISQLIQKKALLEEYKKGVMQQLFTQAIRFKDEQGNDFPDWEEKRYDEVYSFKNTNSYSRNLLSYESGEVRNIHYGDIHTKFKSNFVLQNELVPFIKPEVELKRISDECYLREGDLVIADASEDYADIGKCIEVRDLDGERTLAGLHTFVARPKRGAMAPGFGGYLMQVREVRLKIMTIAQGTKVLGISKTQLCKVLLSIPSPNEQAKIANLLSAIDRKIEIVASQVTETQSFKRGLLQQMFV